MSYPKNMLALALALGSVPAAMAVPFSPIDGRSFSMGGTGVASAKAASAGLFNPALLAAQRQSADFSLILPTVGLIADDSGNVVDTLSDIQDGSLEQMEQAIDNYNAFPSPGNAQGVAAPARALAGDLPRLDGRPVTVEAGVGLGFGVPSKKFGVGLHVTSNLSLGVVTHIDNADIALLNDIADDADTGVFTCPSSYMDAACNIKPADELLDSTVEAVGVGIAELGVSFAREFEIGGSPLAIGITPKFVKIDTIQYLQSVGSDDDIEDIADDERYRKEYTGFNIDVGVAKTFGEEDSALVAGLVIRNLIPQSYKTAGAAGTAAIYEIELNPQIRAGVAKRLSVFNLSADLDLTKNKGVGLNKESQFLAVGAEMDLRYFQLRAGYRHNLVSDGVQDMVTAGIGLGPLDVSAMYADEHSAGVNVQLAFSF